MIFYTLLNFPYHRHSSHPASDSEITTRKGRKHRFVRPQIKRNKPTNKSTRLPALPASYTPAKLPTVEYHAMESNHPANLVLFTTIPACFTGQPPDPDGHSEWIVCAATNRKVLNAPGYPQPVPRPTANVKSYVIKSTLTMGKGVFATRDIQMGEIIFAERPLLVVPRALRSTTEVDAIEYSIEDYTKIMLFQREQQLELAVERMEPDRRAKLMALMNSHLEDGSGPLNGIVRTNGYGVGNLWDGDVKPDDDGSSPYYYSAVCDVGSRINHRFVFLWLFFGRRVEISSLVAALMSAMYSSSPPSPWFSLPPGTSKSANSSSIRTAASNKSLPNEKLNSHPTASLNASALPA